MIPILVAHKRSQTWLEHTGHIDRANIPTKTHLETYTISQPKQHDVAYTAAENIVRAPTAAETAHIING